MDQKTLFDFCARHNIAKMDMQYRDSGLSRFGMGLSGEEPTIICKLEIPVNNLNELAKFELEASHLYHQIAEEAVLREKNPTVMKAYEAYKLLLNLTLEENNEQK